ncbi:hypothetical protein QR680_012477 [Steinernema hermaphroditum]|uniref:RING-type E3 ubiquitin transferase n=1 Tax=Steinernema hermaphroditum TaxID=289476 RepID=A0AA39I4G2_9BILA|nr:hypothetical protein QR680_012477 [Steinernema hermaphroditum]
MGPTTRPKKGQDVIPWDYSMCCLLCKRTFGSSNFPINVKCGHVLCSKCLAKGRVCPIEKTSLGIPVDEAPVNFTFLRMIGLVVGRQRGNVKDRLQIDHLDGLMARIGRHFSKMNTQKGCSVTSASLSRAVQRKALILIRSNVLDMSGRFHCLRSIKSLADRIQNEILLPMMTVTKPSQIWDALRERRCQFLGPAPHLAVLKEVHDIYKDGFTISRKVAVKAITVKMLPNYPTLSKTAIGHLFQILYSGHMFHVVPRADGCAMLRLKTKFYDFEEFYYEHDVSLIRLILDCSLRVDKKLLSKLLYGTLDRQRHVQSIIDRLQNSSVTSRKFMFPVSFLAEKTKRGGALHANGEVCKMVQSLEKLEAIDYNNAPKWNVLLDAAKNLADLVDAYVGANRDDRLKNR